MSNKALDRNGYTYIWVLVDKRGTVLTDEVYGLHGFQPEHGFLGTIWCNRWSARQYRDKLRGRMSAEAWKTWQFRVVGYRRLPQFDNPKGVKRKGGA